MGVEGFEGGGGAGKGDKLGGGGAGMVDRACAPLYYWMG